jgi:hypothetical protein
MDRCVEIGHIRKRSPHGFTFVAGVTSGYLFYPPLNSDAFFTVDPTDSAGNDTAAARIGYSDRLLGVARFLLPPADARGEILC